MIIMPNAHVPPTSPVRSSLFFAHAIENVIPTGVKLRSCPIRFILKLINNPTTAWARVSMYVRIFNMYSGGG